MNKAQEFLLDLGCDDLIINDPYETVDPVNWVYVSEVMEKFLMTQADELIKALNEKKEG